jgi:hypothetical protein
MRLQLHSIAPSAAAFIGVGLALSSSASATQIDAASAVRGSLGVSIEDLVLNGSAGASMFILNAGFTLLFGILAIMIGRVNSRIDGRIPYRASSNFAR